MANLGGFYLGAGTLDLFGLTAERSANPAAPGLLIATETVNGILKPLKNGTAGVDFETSGILYLLPNITNTAAATPGQAASQSDIYKLRAGQTLADKVIGFGYGFANNKPSLPRDQINRVGGVRVDAKDYASASATFFGDRPLDNPGYSKMELTGEVKVGSINKLDVLKVE